MWDYGHCMRFLVRQDLNLMATIRSSREGGIRVWK
jgi:hypothetical protein